MNKPILLSFDKDWMCNPFEERYRITADLGAEEGDKGVIHKYKIEKI